MRALEPIEGVWFFIVFNDTHWNNTFAYRAYLEILVQFLVPCGCAAPECSNYLLIRDRFPGHDSPEITKLLQKHKICSDVIDDTTRGAPNEFCFNKLIRAKFEERQAQVLHDRAKVSAELKRQGLNSRR